MENARQWWSLGDPGGLTLETPFAGVGLILVAGFGVGFFYNG